LQEYFLIAANFGDRHRSAFSVKISSKSIFLKKMGMQHQEIEIKCLTLLFDSIK